MPPVWRWKRRSPRRSTSGGQRRWAYTMQAAAEKAWHSTVDSATPRMPQPSTPANSRSSAAWSVEDSSRMTNGVRELPQERSMAA